MSEKQVTFYLQKVRVENYRSIRSAQIELSPGLNIVIGKNGSGKTNLLRYVDGFFKGALLDEFRLAKGTFIFTGRKSYEVSMEPGSSDVSSKTEDIPVTYSLLDNGVNVEFPKHDGGIEVDWFNVTGYIESDEKVFIGSVLIRHGIPQKLALWNEPLNATITVKALNDIKGFEYAKLFLLNPTEISSHRFFNLCRLMFRRGGQANALSFDDLKAKLYSSSKILVEQFAQVLKRYSPVSDIRLSPNFQIQANEAGEITIRNYSFEFFSENAWRSFSQLSDGTQRIVFILSELMEYNIEGTTVMPGLIMLIEEPELGIHPKLLNGLMDFILSVAETKQVVITTHSPEILDVVDKKELFRINISEHDPVRGSTYRQMTHDEQKEATSYLEKMYLSDFWKYSEFND